MGNTRNLGLLAVVAGVALAIIFALLGVTGAFDGRIGFGLAAICLATAGLIYVFYSRGSVIEKAGYGALLMIIATAFVLPLLTVNQQQAQATATSDQYQLTLKNGAALYGQYCATCHGFLGQGINGPKLNNSKTVNALSDDDLRRIISAGIVDPTNPTTFLMPAWSNRYGSSLTDDDINYLIALIRSSDKSYTSTNHLASTNGFSYVLGTLTNPTQVADYKSQQQQVKAGSSAPPASQVNDFTTQKTVTIDAQNVTGGAGQWGWVAVGADTSKATSGNNAVIKIKAGTTVIWGNKSSQVHNVYSGANGQQTNLFPSDTNLLAANSSDTYKYTFTKAGNYPFFCGLHPFMVGYIEVVP